MENGLAVPEIGIRDEEAPAARLFTDEVGVAAVPGSSFYASDRGVGCGLARVAFPATGETFDVVEKRFEKLKTVG